MRKIGKQCSKTGVVGYSAGARKELEALPEARHAVGSSSNWELAGQFLRSVSMFQRSLLPPANLQINCDNTCCASQ